MENFIIFLSLWIIPLVFVLFLIMEYKSVDLDTQNVADYYDMRKQKWWESGNRYERYVREEVLKIRKQRLINSKHFIE